MPDADAILQSLQQDDRELPWPALEAAAAALVADPSLLDRLGAAYREYIEHSTEYHYSISLYVPFILATAAPRLADADRRRVCQWLVAQLADADTDVLGDGDFECLEHSLATIGPAIVSAISEAIGRMEDLDPGWSILMSLAAEFADGADAAVLEPIRDAAMESLRKAVRGSDLDGVFAAQFLGKIRHEPARAMLERLAPYSRWGEYEEALDALNGEDDIEFSARPSFRDWLDGEWHRERAWVDDPSDYSDEGFPPADDEDDAYENGPDEVEDYGPDGGYAPFSESSTIRRTDPKIGPNDPCPCGSGRKHKKCCGRR